MNLSERSVLDASRPWMAPYAPMAESLAVALRDGRTAVEALSSAAPGRYADGSLPAFVTAETMPSGEAYEATIRRTDAVPTRDNLHDLLNGLVWLRFPHAKRCLNRLQSDEIARAGIGASRGPLRDAATLFDENGAVLDAPPALWDALIARDWRRLFVTERDLWRESRLLIFGHALLEKLAAPRKELTAHVLMAPGASPAIALDDTAIAATLDAAHLASKPFVPLPVLGVPGWWAANEAVSFYADTQVFRPLRTRA